MLSRHSKAKQQQRRHHHHHRPKSLKQQRGVVIIVALFLVALVATMAYVMMSRLERDTRRTSLILRDTQAEFYAQGSIAWAMDQLRNNFDNKKPNQLIDTLPMKSPVNEVDGYKVVSTIYDMQGRFNINNLSNPDAQIDFKRLIQLVSPGTSEGKAIEITIAVFDWISPGAAQSDFNKYYMELPVPYRAAHRPMTSVSELRLVKGMTPQLFGALQPYVTALPAATVINVQTADAPVIAMLSPTINPDTAKAIINLRKEIPFTSPERFLGLDIVKNHQIKPEKVTVESSYFLVETNVTIENQHVVLYTLLERTAKENKGAVTILWQSKGIW